MIRLNIKVNLLLILLIATGFYTCKRSIGTQTGREYDKNLVRVLTKLQHRYAGKKVRINTWDQKLDAYQDFSVLNADNKPLQTLTIGDSVELVGLDLSQPDGIRVEIITSDTITGYIPYWKVEEFEPAVLIDPDLKY